MSIETHLQNEERRKDYVAPTLQVIDMESEGVIANSGIGASGSDIEFASFNSSADLDLMKEIESLTETLSE